MKLVALLLFGFLGLTAFSQKAKAPILVTVTTADGKISANDKVVFTGEKSGVSIIGVTDASGKFTVQLPEGDVYAIKIDAIGEDVDYNTVEIPSLPEGAEFQDMEIAISYWMGDSFTLSDLHFETGKSIITSGSYATLNELAEYLLRKKDLNILVGGHTDNVGSVDGNLKLSKERALAVRTYLIKKGVSAARIQTEGYGMSQPIADNATSSGRAENRRTEIQILD